MKNINYYIGCLLNDKILCKIKKIFSIIKVEGKIMWLREIGSLIE